jgi:hypothetical protein
MAHRFAPASNTPRSPPGSAPASFSFTMRR